MWWERKSIKDTCRKKWFCIQITSWRSLFDRHSIGAWNIITVHRSPDRRTKSDWRLENGWRWWWGKARQQRARPDETKERKIVFLFSSGPIPIKFFGISLCFSFFLSLFDSFREYGPSSSIEKERLLLLLHMPTIHLYSRGMHSCSCSSSRHTDRSCLVFSWRSSLK